MSTFVARTAQGNRYWRDENEALRLGEPADATLWLILIDGVAPGTPIKSGDTVRIRTVNYDRYLRADSHTSAERVRVHPDFHDDPIARSVITKVGAAVGDPIHYGDAFIIHGLRHNAYFTAPELNNDMVKLTQIVPSATVMIFEKSYPEFKLCMGVDFVNDPMSFEARAWAYECDTGRRRHVDRIELQIDFNGREDKTYTCLGTSFCVYGEQGNDVFYSRIDVVYVYGYVGKVYAFERKPPPPGL